MERFAGLRERLLAEGAEEVALSFEEFDVFLVGGLPLSAQRDVSWWANSDGPLHPQAHGWLDAGYVVDRIDLVARAVRFRRTCR